MQAVEENVAGQQQVLMLMSEKGEELKKSLESLLPSRPVDNISTELDTVQDNWQLAADVSRFCVHYYMNCCKFIIIHNLAVVTV